MSGSKSEQSVNIKFPWKLKKYTTETFHPIGKTWFPVTFPKIKLVLKGTNCMLLEDVKAKMMDIVKSLSENDLWNCFECWQLHMQPSVNSEGNYFDLLNKK